VFTKLVILTESYRDCLTKDGTLWNNLDIVNAKLPTIPMTLSSLQPGEIATIIAIHTDEALHQRLLAMGFRAGKQIELIRKARFSGPLQVRIGTTDILLRKAEAEKITVQL
jgi:ferrous iron transport protein A